jgi:hypothetical protein
MMAIHSERNLYPGINAHLNSFLQNEPGGWANFHAEHIVHLREVLDECLPSGYFARSEKSLQIGEFDAGTGVESRRGTKPDVTVFRSGIPSTAQSAAPIAAEPTGTLPITDTIEEEEAFTGLVIYQAGEGSVLGRPVTRVELLSPANKPGGNHHGQYIVKRLETLKSGLRLVEVDYLQQTPPVIRVLPSYPVGDEGATAYTILVSDPRPTLEQGTTAVYGFHVDESLPVIPIPLAGADVVNLDFGLVYQQTFERSRFFQMVVDYAQDPVGLNRYQAADRERIEKRLKHIREAHRSGE